MIKARLSIILGTSIIAIFLVILLTLEIAPDRAIQLAMVSTFFAAISSVATLMQARELQRQREDAERPEVTVYFQPRQGAMYCVIQNFGSLPAKNIRIKFETSPVLHDGRLLKDLSLFTNIIPLLPPNEKYWRLLGALPDVLKKNPNPFNVSISYESLSGRNFDESFTVNFSVLSEAHHPAPTVADQLGGINSALEKISKLLERRETAMLYSQMKQDDES